LIYALHSPVESAIWRFGRPAWSAGALVETFRDRGEEGYREWIHPRSSDGCGTWKQWNY